MDYREGVDHISEVAEKHLKDGVMRYETVYRFVDCGPFGKGGYSLVLCKKPNFMMGVDFGYDIPSDKLIIKKVKQIMGKFNVIFREKR